MTVPQLCAWWPSTRRVEGLFSCPQKGGTRPSKSRVRARAEKDSAIERAWSPARAVPNSPCSAEYRGLSVSDLQDLRGDCGPFVSSTSSPRTRLRGSPRAYRFAPASWTDLVGPTAIAFGSDPGRYGEGVCANTCASNRNIPVEVGAVGHRRIEQRKSSNWAACARRSNCGQVFRHDRSARYSDSPAFCPRRWPAWLA